MKRAFRHLLRSDPDHAASLEQLARARDRGYWRALAPALSVEGPPPAPGAGDAAAPLDAASLLQSVAEDGYARTGPLVPEACTDGVLAAVRAVEADGWPLVFAFVYDAVWDALRAPALVAALSALLGEGHRQLPGIWLHAVPATKGARGWGPHVDVARPARLRADGRADRLTAWIPLVDAGPDNACISVIPACHLPEGFAARFDIHETIDMELALRLLHAARPLPAARGALLVWRFDVVHWGGFHAGPPAGPRLSLSLEYLHEDEEPSLEEGFSLDARARPAFEERLALIGRGLLAYGKAEDREPLASRFLRLGERLFR